MRIMSINFTDVPLLNRDLAGAGENNIGKKKRFSVPIEEQELADQLTRVGVKLWVLASDPTQTPRLNVIYDNRFGDVKVVMVDGNGRPTRLDDTTIAILDNAYIKSAELYVEVQKYPNRTTGGDVITAFVKTMVVTCMNDEEEAEAKSRRPLDPVRMKHPELFDGED